MARWTLAAEAAQHFFNTEAYRVQVAAEFTYYVSVDVCQLWELKLSVNANKKLKTTTKLRQNEETFSIELLMYFMQAQL
jgi:hypothetical protein